MPAIKPAIPQALSPTLRQGDTQATGTARPSAGQARSVAAEGALAGLGRKKTPSAPGVERATSRLATLQKLADNQLITDNTHYNKAQPLVAELNTHYPDYESKLQGEVAQGGLKEGDYANRLNLVKTSLDGVDKVRNKLADLDVGGQQAAQMVGNLARGLAPQIADKVTDASVHALGLLIAQKTKTHVMPENAVDAVRVTAAKSAMDGIKEFQALNQRQPPPTEQETLAAIDKVKSALVNAFE